MNLAFLASFIALCLILSISIKKQNKQYREQENQFWERERRANNIRKKSLDDLNYIHIPLETFPTHLLQENETVRECIDTLEALTAEKIVNLTGYSNTDLKLTYGTANITALSGYDENFTVLVRTLQKYADVLSENGYTSEAAPLLEYAVQIGSDISRTYYQLADFYVKSGQSDKIDSLIASADTLHSSLGPVIVNTLRETYPHVF